VLRCVGFLSPREDASPDGTVFFVKVNDPATSSEVSGVYAVTAKHMLQDYAVEESSDKAWLRLNKRAGGVARIYTQIKDWIQHPDADVAIHPWPREHCFDIESFPVRQHLIDDIKVEWKVGPGDEVFLSGLFWHHSGETKNAPIVRVGNIAAMRGDKIYTTNYGPMDAYLIEVRSLGGLSGSPVFFNGGGLRTMSIPAVSIGGRPLPSRTEKRVLAEGFFLLGLVHGHYRERAQRIDIEEGFINSGVAIVVPADKIQELIVDPKEVDIRRKRNEEENRKKASTASDRAKPELTDEEFQKTLERASHRVAPD